MFESQGFMRLIPLLLLVLCASPARAGTGKIAGTATDAETGAPLAEVNIILGVANQGATTDDRGHFIMLNVPPGSHTLTAKYVGYRTLSLEAVRVSAGLTTDLELVLSSSAIAVEAVVVRAKRALIDKNATNAVRIVSGEDLQLLPFRGVQNVVALQPGVVEDEGDLHVRGSRADEIGFYVDGASVRNAVTGNAAVGLIDEALAEIQLQAGGFNAEYGGANAGILLQELRTGAPEWRIDLLLESDNFTSDHEKRLGAYSYGYGNQVLTLSGPVAGNRKIRAFAAVQRRVQDSAPVFWDGFSSTDQVDSGGRGGSVHWASPDAPDSVDLVLGAGNIEHTGSERLDFNGSLLFDYFPFQLRLTGLYTGEDEELNPAPVRNMLNLARLPESERSARLLNLKGVHFLDANTFYELNLSFYSQEQQIFDPLFKDDFMLYNDSLAVAQAGADFVSYSRQGVAPLPYDVGRFPIHRPGTPTSDLDGSNRSSFYVDEEDGYWGLGGGLTRQTEVHLLKFGFDYQRWTARRYSIAMGSLRSDIAAAYPNLEAVYQRYYDDAIDADQVLGELIKAAEAAPEGQNDIDDFKRLVRTTSRTDFFGFDEFGRQSDGSGLEAPRHPVLASAYLQDKAEYADLVINAGLRWDFFDADSWRFVDPAAPSRDETAFTINLDSMRPTRTFHELSPRLGLSFPVSERTVFHVQYGRFSQMPALRDLFAGGARLADELGGSGFNAAPTAFDIEPIRTTQYEIGFERQFTNSASFDLTGFYRDVRGQLQVRKQVLSSATGGASAYNFLQNGDFATTRGVELVFKTRRTHRLRSELNYTFSDARGTGSTTVSALSGVENDKGLPTIIAPLDFNQTHRGNIYLDYRYAAGDGGLLQRAGANLLFKFDSGHNYTLVDGTIGQRGPELGGILASDDPRNRSPIGGINRATTPWTFEVDLRVDKGFALFGTDVRAYAYVLNLFNRRNDINVYGRTGNAGDDGFLTDPQLSGQIVEASGGDTYEELYRAINLDHRQHYWFTEGGDLYGAPRQVRFGLQFDL